MMARARLLLLPPLLALLALMAAGGARALDFEMNTQTKCVYEEINAGALVVGDYSVLHRDNAAQAVYADVRVSWKGGTRRRRPCATMMMMAVRGVVGLCFSGGGWCRLFPSLPLPLSQASIPSSTPPKKTTHPPPAHTQVTDPAGALLHENRGQTKGQFAFTAKTAGEHAACFTVAGELAASAFGGAPRARAERRSRELRALSLCLSLFPLTPPRPPSPPLPHNKTPNQNKTNTKPKQNKDPGTALHTKLSVDWRTGVAATDWDNIAKKEHLDALSVEMRKLEGSIREIYAEMLQLQQREQEMRDLNGEREREEEEQEGWQDGRTRAPRHDNSRQPKPQNQNPNRDHQHARGVVLHLLAAGDGRDGRVHRLPPPRLLQEAEAGVRRAGVFVWRRSASRWSPPVLNFFSHHPSLFTRCWRLLSCV